MLRLRPRFRDTDAMGHVNNAVFFTYFEEARAEYYRQVVGLDSYRNVGIILAQTRCDYRSPLFVGEEVEIGTRVDRIGRKSFEMSFAVHACADGRLVAEGMCVNVAYDYGAGQTIAIPDEFRRLASAYEGKPLE